MLRKPSSEPFCETPNRLLNIKCMVLTFYWDRLVGIEVKNCAHMVTCPFCFNLQRSLDANNKFLIETQKNSNVAAGDFNRPSNGINLRPILFGDCPFK
jgi:hypothetical protein